MGKASAGAGKMGRLMLNNNAGIPNRTNLGRYNISFIDCNQRGTGSGVGFDSGALRFINGSDRGTKEPASGESAPVCFHLKKD